MEYEAQRIGKIKGCEVYQVGAPLDEQINAFQRKGIVAPFLATPEDIAQIRLDGLSTDNSRTSIAPIGIKGGKTILYKNSPLMNPLMAAFAVQSHRNGNCPSFSKEIYEAAESLAKSQEGLEPEDRTAIIVSQDGDFKLTPEMEESKFSLGKLAILYFAKFTEGEIPFYNLSADSKDKALVNYLWFNIPQYESNLYCRDRNLDNDNRAFGVLRTAEGSARNFGYNLTEIRNANSENIKEVLGGTPALEKSLGEMLNKGLVGKLRQK